MEETGFIVDVARVVDLTDDAVDMVVDKADDVVVEDNDDVVVDAMAPPTLKRGVKLYSSGLPSLRISSV